MSEKYVNVNLTVSEDLLKRVNNKIGLNNVNLSGILLDEIKSEIETGKSSTTC